jgi:hypothetical protein
MWRNVSAPSRTLHNYSTAAGILAVSKPILAFSSSQLCSVPIPRESTVVSVYRNTSDAAQTFLPPVQAAADTIPGVGGIIKGVIGGMLGTLQLVDVIRFRYRVSLSLMLNCAIIEVHPEQARVGEAHPPIIPASPTYRQCTHPSDYH